MQTINPDVYVNLIAHELLADAMFDVESEAYYHGDAVKIANGQMFRWFHSDDPLRPKTIGEWQEVGELLGVEGGFLEIQGELSQRIRSRLSHMLTMFKVLDEDQFKPLEIISGLADRPGVDREEFEQLARRYYFLDLYHPLLIVPSLSAPEMRAEAMVEWLAKVGSLDHDRKISSNFEEQTRKMGSLDLVELFQICTNVMAAHALCGDLSEQMVMARLADTAGISALAHFDTDDYEIERAANCLTGMTFVEVDSQLESESPEHHKKWLDMRKSLAIAV